ncbi:MAG TPA: hypothetical protein VJ770_25470 [Stellaceae bacterium]|nr:hypothetical protein [Stellaceae bacterium]
MSFSAFSLAAAPLLSWPALEALAGVCVLVLVLGIWRRARGLAWRAIAFAILLAALVNPSVVVEKRLPQRDVAIVVVDQSPSNQEIGRRREATEAALATLQRRLAHEPNLDVRIVRAGQERPGAGNDGTRLFAALDREMATVPRQQLAGVVMITDGEVHDAPNGDRQALERAVSAPFHVLLSGQPHEADRRLVVTRAPSYGLVGKEVTLRIRVEDLPKTRDDDGGMATVTWRKDGGARHEIAVPIGAEVSMPIPIDHGGPNIVELATASGPHSLTPVNKHAVVAVNGVRDRLRVLLVTGEPYAGERVWRNILKSDPSVDLVHFTILRPPEKQDGTPIRELSLIAFPIRELFDVKLKQFDLIIFDRYNRRGLIPESYLDNVARYVRDGGAFLEAAGPRFGSPTSLYRTPLGEILPSEPTGNVYEGGFKPRLSALGRRDPVTAGLPGAGPSGSQPSWGRWFRQVDADVHHGVTVMRGAEGEPLLVLDRVGKGRVAQLLSDQMWLWARGFEGGGPQAELLRRLAYWLMKEPDLEENDLRAMVEGDRLVVTRQSLEPDDRPVHVTLPDGSSRTLALSPAGGGRSTGSLPITAMGLYRVSGGGHTALAAAGPLNPKEFADVRTTPDRLAPLVAATGGGVFWAGSGKIPQIRLVSADHRAAGADWLGLRMNGAYTVTGFTETPLLPGIAVLLLILGGLLAAWRREGR